MGLPSFAVVDLETSGFSTRRHRILQLGLVVVDAEGQVADRWSTLVRLRWPLARVGPTHVHGLTRRRLRGAPPIGEVLDELEERMGSALFTAHNARFDGEFLDAARRRSRAARGSGDEPGDGDGGAFSRRLCTLRMSRRLDPDRQLSHRLVDVCERYGVALDRPHDALADATSTAEILPHLLRAHEVSEFADLEPFLDRPHTARRPRLRR